MMTTRQFAPVRRLASPLAAVLLLSGAAAAAPQLSLETVLDKMNQTATEFRSAQADFTWTIYNSVINDVAEKQTGRIYFRRNGDETKMAADIAEPEAKQVVFANGKIEIYEPTLNTEHVYDASAHREEFETFLVLGFGSSGSEMQKSFEVKYDGAEPVDGVQTAKLELTPKSEKIRQHFTQIVLWIDPERGVSLQQKLVEPNGDYRLAQYSHIEINQKVPEKVFKIKTSDSVKILNH
jgi:outer membrane lipoprotein-sorting protein